jgi:hypothetical protein
VDTITGAAKLMLVGHDHHLRTKITDPALKVPENVYTHALDTAAVVTVTAKPVLKEGVVSTLYVSDATADAFPTSRGRKITKRKKRR